MANVGTSTVAYATQQPTGSLVFIASDGTACVLWNDGTNQKFSYASSPYSSWTTTTLITGLNMALGGRFRSGSDNIDVVTGASSTVRPNYYPLTKIGATYSLGTANQISTTAAGTSAVGNVMAYCGQDPQGRHWIVCGGASTYTAETGYLSPANAPTTAGWTASPTSAVAQTGDVNLPAGDQIASFILRIWWNGTALQYSRADNSASTIGAWATAATIPNLTGSPNGSSRVVFRALSSTQALLAYSTGSGIYAQTYNPSTNAFSTATQLSTNASDRHPAIATDGIGNAWVTWCSFAATNSYALVYKKWDGVVWDAAATTLIASGTNIANPNAGYGNQTIGVTYTQGTANPFTVGWTTFSSIITRTRTVPATAAFSGYDWYIPGWRSKKQLTLNHTQVSGGVDLVDFPVLVSLTDVDFKTVANGGKVQNASGFDLIFLDSSQTIQLDHEIEKYDGVAGTITMWARVPTLSASVDTSIYCYFNNTSITTSRENKVGVWKNSFDGVWHLSETAGNNADSSGKGNNFTSVTVTSRGVTAKIAGGNTYNGTSDFETAASAASQLPASITLSTWVNLTALPAAGALAILIRKAHTASPWSSYILAIDQSGHVHGEWYNDSLTGFTTTGSSVLATGTWYRVSMTFDATSKVLQVYLSGVADQVSPTTASGNILQSADVLELSDGGTNKLNGSLDEPHLDAVVRTAGWQVTEYNNQNAPGTFCTPGATALISHSPRIVPGTAAVLQTQARTLPATVALLPAGTVTRSGSQLLLNGVTFRFSGPNIYWLGLAEVPTVHYPSQFTIDDALRTAKEMGATVVRAHTLGISVGNALSIEPSLGTFNDAAFDPIDYAIKRSGELGIKLVIPFADNWHFYFGGKHTFTDWRSLSDETLFYTNSTVIADFEAYISHLLNHTNAYTGVTLKNDPTIMAWETGNELNGAPAAWTNTITTYIKSIDLMHLVFAGNLVQVTDASTLSSELAETNLDLFTDHFYPPDTGVLATNQAAVTPSSKVYVVGEYDWTDQDDAAATFAIDATDRHGGTYSAKVIVTTPSLVNAWHVQLLQTGFALAATTYTVSFWAKASVARSLEVMVQENHDAFTIYTQQTVNLTTSWAQYILTAFTMGGSDANALIAFDCASVTSSIWIDDVNINSGGANLLSNPGFETGALSPWATKVVPSSTLAAFLSAIESNTSIAGDLFWVIYPHADAYGFVIHNDILTGGVYYTYSLYYPGQTASQQTNAQALRTHAYTMSSLTVPAALIPAAPANLSVVSDAVSWQGVVGAKTYDVERSTTSGSSGFSVIGTGLTDFSTPWTDAVAGSFPSKWYRVRGYNVDAVAGAYSSVVFIGSPTRTLGASAALIGTGTRTIPASAAFLAMKTRTIGATLATLATSTRTVPESVTLLSSPTRTVGSSTALIATLTRSMGASSALLLTRTRTISTSAALGITSIRQVSSTVTLLATSTRTVLASGAMQNQASRSIPVSGALSIARVVPTSVALLLTQVRTIPTSTALLLARTRQVGTSVALLATTTRTIPTTGALQGQGSRSIPATGALSITRVVPTSTALLLASSRVVPTSAAFAATSARTVGSSVALLSTRLRTLGASAPLLASLSRSIGAGAPLLSTRTRTTPTDVALSLTGTATRTIPTTVALLTSVSRNVGASATLGLSNVNRTMPATTALLQQASRTIPASTPLQATASRQVTASVALVSQAGRSIPVNAALIGTLTRSSGATVALIITLSRTLGTSAALTLPGVKFRDIPCSATLSGGSRVIPATVALRGIQTRSIPCTASISLFFEGVQIGIPASAALQSTSSRFVVCTVALVASNAFLRFRSGVVDVRVRSGKASIIVS